MKKCMYCGQENEDSSVVCVKCGNTLLDIPADQVPPLEETADDAQAVIPTVDNMAAAGPDASAASGDIQNTDGQQSYSQQTQGYPGDGFQQGYMQQGQDYPGNGFAQGYPQGADQQNDGSQTGQVYPGAGYQQGYPQQGADYSNAGYQPAQEYPGNGQQGYPGNGQQGYPGNGQQGYPGNGQQGYPGNAYQAGYPQQGREYPGNGFYYGQQDAGSDGPGYQPGYPQENGDGPYDDADQADAPSPYLMEKARKCVKSPLFLIATLCFSVYVISAIIYNVTGASITNLATLQNTLKGIIGENVAFDYLNKGLVYIQTQEASSLLMTRLISASLMIPSLLIMLGLWMAFAGISPKNKEVNTSGLTLMRVVLIIEFIAVCIGLLACIGLCVAYVVAAGAAQSMMTLIVGIVALLIVVILTVLTILFFIQLLFSIRVVRTNCRTGKDIGRIPGFLIFVGVLSLIISAASVIMMAPDDYIGLVCGGANAAALLFFIIWAIVYRVTVRDE